MTSFSFIWIFNFTEMFIFKIIYQFLIKSNQQRKLIARHSRYYCFPDCTSL
ncbi:hypothetical protein HCH_05145 [Hahella chejuensis KCTC 2396]|uniref:Uncharacterized protein n=1 Tax=Hahella chejuensis (strain KCTC 2396) TaxID=349521 RepID=Q2SBZ9_HAHCH|nr:hypothetical protein HCH_05145 [Hahella chejuensis KCTC 2396]